MKKVLIITYYWPPAGGPGVQRVLKFAKYLPEFGWEPIILTVKNGEYPAYDESLRKDIPDSCKVYNTPALEPFLLYKKFTGMAEDEQIPTAALTEKKINWKKKVAHWIRLNIFVPDAKIGWIPFAVKAGKHIIQKENPDIIFSSSPPPTVHLIAKSLDRWSRIKWVADFRDPWTDIYHYEKNKISFLSALFNKKLEKNVLKSTKNIICVSKGFFQDHNLSYKVIPNGFDRSDLKIASKKGKDTFTICYMGSLKERQYVDNLFEVLKDLTKKDRYKNKIKLEFIGNVFKNVKNKIMSKKSKNLDINFLGYKPHTKAISLINHAEALLFIIGKGEMGKYITTGKLFEYIMVKKPIIAFGPVGGAADKIITKTNTGKMFDYSDFTEVKNYIVKLFALWLKNESLEFKETKINTYSRKNLTKKLTKLF